MNPGVRSVDRAVTLLEILAREGWGGVSELARELGTHRSTVFRLLATLERRGIVEQHRETLKYRLGFGVLRLASGVRASLDLGRVARPECEALSRELDETVHLAVLEADDVVHVDEINLSSQLISVNWLGRHTALHATSSGKVFLAHLPPRVVADLIDAGLEALTDATIVDPRLLRNELAEVRERGYAATLQELEESLNAVAAPIWGEDGSVVACVSVSGPSYRLAADDVPAIGARTVEAAARISRRLGFLGERWSDQDDPERSAEDEPGLAPPA